MMFEGDKYIVDSIDKIDSWIKSLQQSYDVVETKNEIFDLALFDTFSWDLFKKERLFYALDRKFYYQTFNGRKSRVKIPYQKHYRPSDPVTNSTEFSKIKNYSKIRAVSRTAKWEVNRKIYTLLNRNKKNVISVYLENYNYKHQNILLARLIKAPEIIEDFQYISTWAEKHKFLKLDDNIFKYLLNRRNQYPLKYSTKIHLECSPDTQIFLAIREIFEKGRDNLIVNFKGICKDLDSEYLHDFRTTTRRLRSAISQFKSICNSYTYEKLKFHLLYLQKSTNELRDLDVDLLGKKEYYKILPKKYKEGLDILFVLLQEKRSSVFEEFMLKEESFELTSSIKEISSFVFNLHSKNEKIPEAAKTPIKVEADKILKHRFNKIIQLGEKLAIVSPDEEIHAFRIKCKKFRYSLEFFKNYYSEKRITQFLIKLKALQDNLGIFNDLSVQINRLDYFRNSFTHSERQKKELSNLLNYLTQYKEKEKLKIRNEILIQLKSFLSKRTSNSFYELFTN